MNWQETLEEICSVDFDVSLNVVSSTNGYFRAVSQHPAVKEAYRLMLESGELYEDTLCHIYTLANMEVEPQFENPNDTALAVLLWLTNFAFPDNAQLAATYANQAPHCWHAKKLAQRILNPPPSATRNYRIPRESSGMVMIVNTSASIRLPTPLILDSPQAFHGKNSQTGASVVDAMWSSS